MNQFVQRFSKENDRKLSMIHAFINNYHISQPLTDEQFVIYDICNFFYLSFQKVNNRRGK